MGIRVKEDYPKHQEKILFEKELIAKKHYKKQNRKKLTVATARRLGIILEIKLIKDLRKNMKFLH